MKRAKTRMLLTTCAAAVCAPLVASAADSIWDGGGSNDFTNTPANWATNVAPVADDALIFAGSMRTTPNNNITTGTSFKGITFDTGAAPFTLSGNAISLHPNTELVGITTNQTGIVNNAANLQTVTLPLTLQRGDHLFKTGTNTLALNGAITRNSGAIARFSGTVSSTTLANDGTGILGNWATIGTDHATINAGQVVAYTGYTPVGDTPAGPAPISNNPGANVRWTQGSSGFTFTMSNSTIDINTLTFTNNTPMTLNFDTSTVLRFGPAGGIFRASTLGGSSITFGIFGEDGVGTITAGGAANTPGELIFNFNNGGMIVRPRIADNGSGAVKLVVTNNDLNGAGELNLSASANNYSGGTFVASGILRGTHQNALGTGPVYVAKGGHAYLDEFNQPSGSLRTYPNDFYLEGDGASPALREGALRLGRENIAVSGTIHLLSDTRIQGRLALGAGGHLFGQITGNSALKLGGGGGTQVGTLTLYSTANDWTGNTGIDLGTVKIGGTGEVIPNGAGKGNVYFSNTSGTFNLNGLTETINGLTGGQDPDELDNHKIINSSSNPAHLILGDNNAGGSFGLPDYQINPGGQIEQTAGTISLTKIGSGTQNLSKVTYTGATTATGGKLSFGVSVTTSSTMNASGGTIELKPHGDNVFVLRTNSITVSEGGKVDLQDNTAIVDGGDIGTATGGVYTGITRYLQTGRNGGAWNGSGIISTSAGGTNNLESLGVARAGDVLTFNGTTALFSGQTITSTGAVLVKYTYSGDANLSGNIDIDDYTLIDTEYDIEHGGNGTIVHAWHNGDFDYNGKVNIDDYSLIDTAYRNQGVMLAPGLLSEVSVESLGGGVSAAPALDSVAAVPEPVALWLAALGMAGLRRRRPQ